MKRDNGKDNGNYKDYRGNVRFITYTFGVIGYMYTYIC